jgi:hypothetical protein
VERQVVAAVALADLRAKHGGPISPAVLIAAARDERSVFHRFFDWVDGEDEPFDAAASLRRIMEGE